MVPRSLRGDLEWERRARTYLWSAWSAVPGSIVYALIYWCLLPDDGARPAAIVAAGMLFFLFGPVGLRLTGSVDGMISLVLSYAVFEATALSLLQGGIVSPIPVWATLIVIASALVGGPRMATVWWAAVLLVYTGLFAVHGFELELPRQLPESFLGWLWFPANLYQGVLALGLFAWFEVARRRAVEGLGGVRAKLEAARARADAADRSRSDFLSRMSHELRSPLMAILGFTDLLVDGEAGDEEQHPPGALQAMKRSGAHLLQMVDDVLDVSMIESDTLPIDARPFSPAEIVEEAIAIARLSADRKQVRLHGRCNGVPDTLVGDAIRVRQILVNLVANATKFTVQGEVEVYAEWCAKPEPQLMLEVRDTGIGMTPEQQQRLFRPYEQAEAATARLYGGTGLGLTISKLLAEALGGSIDVHSVPGSGTQVRVRIPAPLGKARQSSAATGSARAESLAGLRVLVVDDLGDNRVLVSHHLRRAGANVESAASGEAALAAIGRAAERGQAPDVVLMDLHMPGMDGHETTAELRRSGFMGRIVALTADALAATRMRCLESGFDDFGTKPISQERLLELALRNRWRALAAPPAPASGGSAAEQTSEAAAARAAQGTAASAARQPKGAILRLLERLDSWIDSFAPPDCNADARRQAQLTVRYALAPLMLLPIELMFPLALAPEFRPVVWVLLLVQLPLLLRVPFKLYETGSTDRATRPVLWYVFVTVAFLCLITGGVRSPAVPWNIAPTVLAIVLCSRAVAVRWTLLGMALQCALFACQLLEVPLPSALLPARVAGAHWVSYVAFVSVCFAAALVYQMDKREALATLLSANASLRRALDTAERASASKARFLATLSHEMRTPMTAILGFAELMAEKDRAEELDSQHRAALARILVNARRLLRLLNNLLDLSKLEAGLLQIERVPMHLGALLAELREQACDARAGRPLELALEIGNAVPEWIEDDPTRVRQILVELLENARQHAGEGRVVLRVSRRPMPPGIAFEVQDSGPGLSPDTLQLWNGDNTDLAPKPGATPSLGRLICAGLARLLGAELHTSNDYRGGASFRLSLPLHAGARGVLAPTWNVTERPGTPALAATRILLVEDSPDSRRLIAQILREAGAELEMAGNGGAALDQVHRAGERGTRFDLILMDMQLPVLSGLEATRRLRELGHTLPIIALTAEDLADARGPCLEAGCNDVASKPIDRRALTSVVTTALRHNTQARSAATRS